MTPSVRFESSIPAGTRKCWVGASFFGKKLWRSEVNRSKMLNRWTRSPEWVRLDGKRTKSGIVNWNRIVDYVVPIVLIVIGLVLYWLLRGIEIKRGCGVGGFGWDLTRIVTRRGFDNEDSSFNQ